MNSETIVENGLNYFDAHYRPGIIFCNNYPHDNSIWFSYFPHGYKDWGVYDKAVAIFKIKYHDNKN